MAKKTRDATVLVPVSFKKPRRQRKVQTVNKIPLPDVRVRSGGNQFMVTPVSDAAKAWVDENVALEGWQWMGAAFAVDQHYIMSLVAGMQGAGLDVDTSGSLSL